MKVLLVQGALMSTQMAPWEGAAEHGVDLHVVCAPFDDRGQVPSTKPPDTFAIHPFRPRGWVSRGHLWWLYPGLGRFIKRLKPDLVHVTAEVYGLFYSQLNFGEYPITGHAVDNIWTHGSRLESAIRLRRASRILPRLSGLASWNQRGIELGLEFGLRPSVPTTILPARLSNATRFLDAAGERAQHRRAFGFGNECVVGYVGRIVPEKGIDWLFESFAASSVREHARLVVVGSGRKEGELKALAGSLNLDVGWLGPLAPESIPELLAALDVLVVPSLTIPDWAEQFGRVIVEAMFAGTPVIASSSGSIPEVVAGAGTLVPEGDREALTAALEALVSDSDYRVALGEKGRRSALARYSSDALGRLLADFWGRSALSP